MHRPRVLTLALAAFVCLGIVAPGIASASSDSYFEKVASALHKQPVYVDPQAQPSLSPDQVNNLVSQIRASHHQIYPARLLCKVLQATTETVPPQALRWRNVGILLSSLPICAILVPKVAYHGPCQSFYIRLAYIFPASLEAPKESLPRLLRYRLPVTVPCS